jgi:hypothetical protein
VMKKEFIKYIGSFLDWNVLRIEIFSWICHLYLLIFIIS